MVFKKVTRFVQWLVGQPKPGHYINSHVLNARYEVLSRLRVHVCIRAVDSTGVCKKTEAAGGRSKVNTNLALWAKSISNIYWCSVCYNVLVLLCSVTRESNSKNCGTSYGTPV